MQDPFVGTWKLNVEKSEFDANHRPTAGTMVFELDAAGPLSDDGAGAETPRARKWRNGQRSSSRMAKSIPSRISPALNPSRPGRTRIRSRARREGKTGPWLAAARTSSRRTESRSRQPTLAGILNCGNSSSALCGTAGNQLYRAANFSRGDCVSCLPLALRLHQ